MKNTGNSYGKEFSNIIDIHLRRLVNSTETATTKTQAWVYELATEARRECLKMKPGKTTKNKMYNQDA